MSSKAKWIRFAVYRWDQSPIDASTSPKYFYEGGKGLGDAIQYAFKHHGRVLDLFQTSPGGSCEILYDRCQ